MQYTESSMTKTYTAIYVPGLGDHRTRGEDKIGSLWRFFHNIDVDYHPVIWNSGAHFAPKLESLNRHIEQLYADHGRIALIGSSAGATAVIHALAAHPDKVSAVVSICGKLKNPQTISQTYQAQNPAFMDSLEQLPASIASLSDDSLHRVLSIIPLQDGTVPLHDMEIPGATHARQHTIGHAASIALGLTFASRRPARFIKQSS